MKIVHKYEDVFYGAGIDKTHLVDDVKDKTKTLCGRDWRVFNGQSPKLEELSFKDDGTFRFVDCKLCLRKVKK